ncbi:hypothetical protein BC936DRAFT_138755 [Jimgerdemannia flammicorona]|uniref:Uncharacterized protein n=2 Tax=Jimgerdemannia flammicorona TaxID=994334 RepID=A0A433Q575_9FUNG|nr:hypothetical protein BC936DRAFT_138755 [Jimgerdemannia flammicorona]RUS24929.1 hypothetical protein BC938DRAFT_472887 [Jimgerdemannia flammicorona]
MKFNILAISLAILVFLAAQGSARKAKSLSKAKQATSCQQKSTLTGKLESATDIASIARTAGFSGNGLIISIAIALAESSGYTQAVLVNTDCSRDRGLWQINSRWHAEVTDSQAFNPQSCAKAAFTISSGGTNWQQWTTYTNGDYQKHMAEAQKAVGKNPGKTPTPVPGGSVCKNYGATCSSSARCCSQYGYCGSTSEYCGTGCVASASFNGKCA